MRVKPASESAPSFSRRSFLALVAGSAFGAAAERVSNAEAICGTWVLQQTSSKAELERILPTVLALALGTPHVRGFSLRVPWRAIAADLSLLEAGRKIARERNLAFSLRFMAGRHTPAGVFEKGCSFRTSNAKAIESEPHPDRRVSCPLVPMFSSHVPVCCIRFHSCLRRLLAQVEKTRKIQPVRDVTSARWLPPAPRPGEFRGRCRVHQ